MAYYTIKSRDEVARMLSNSAANNPQSQVIYNALGRDDGTTTNTQDDNFFMKRAKSAENAIGTTGAALYETRGDLLSPIIARMTGSDYTSGRSAEQNEKTAKLLEENKQSRINLANKYGYADMDALYDALENAEKNGDTALASKLYQAENEDKSLAKSNSDAMKQNINEYKDYVENNYASQKINQDRGKFLGDSMNTLSTAADIMTMAAGIPVGPALNSVQGAWEGVADELSQNGLENFDWGRAGQNAAIGATTGAITGGINKGINGALAKRAAAKGLTNAAAKGGIGTAIKNGVKTIGGGAARGALSGAVGGAVGAGMSSAMNGVEVGQGIQNALEGGIKGAAQGAITGGTMAGINMAGNAALNKFVPNVAQRMNENAARNQSYGDSLRDQFKGAWNSGDSAVAEGIKNLPTNIRTLADKANEHGVGLSIKDVSNSNDKYYDKVKEYNPKLFEDLNNTDDVYEQNDLIYAARQKLVDKMRKNGAMTQQDLDFNPEYTLYRIMEMDNIAQQFGFKDFSDATKQYQIQTGTDKLPRHDDVERWMNTTLTRIPSSTSAVNLPEDVRNMNINDYTAVDDTDTTEAVITPKKTTKTTKAKTVQTAPVATSTTDLSSWDQIAREGGYASYDDAIKSFQAANPKAEVNASSVLTWMDENPGNWNPNATTGQTQVYDALTGEEEPVNVKRVPTGEEIKNKRLLTEEIISQFNAPDKPTVRATKPADTFYKLYDEWGLSDGDDIRQAVSYADPDGLIPQMIREAAGEVGVIDLSDAQGLVMDLKINKQASSKMINALENIMDSTDTTIVGGKSGVDALQFQRTLEKMASDARGTNGTYHIGNSVVDETMARNFDRIARNIGDKLDQASVSKGAVKNVLNRHAADINNMRNTFGDNAKWQDAVDTKVSGANNISDLRHSIKELTRANIFINNGDENYATVGGRMAAKNRNLPTSKAGLTNRVVNDVYDKIQSSKVARQARLNKYDQNIKDAQTANITEASTTPTTATAPSTVSNTAPTTTATPSTRIYDMIGRDAGNTAGENVQASDYVNMVVDGTTKDGYVAPLGTTASTAASLENLAGNTNPNTSVYDTVYGTPTSTNTGYTGADLKQAGLLGLFGNTGDYNLDIIGGAMELALMRGDETSFNELSSIYKMMASSLADSKSSQESVTKLTDKQRSANAAMDALNELENAEHNFAYDLSNIPVVGNIATWGGNDYKNKADALALQVGYMLSGATVNKDEAQRIIDAYVPKPMDNEATRKSKLAQLRGIISEYQQAYAE